MASRSSLQNLQTLLAVALSALLSCSAFLADIKAIPTLPTGSQCPGELPPPDTPFRVVWNHPDPCERKGVHMNFSEYGIVFNTGRSFIGDEVQTLYKTGRWPRYSGSRPIEGGLPQLFNDSTFAKTREDLSRNRKQDFKGLAIIDFESWRANYITNFGSLAVYQRESVKLVEQQHPDWPIARVKQEAAKEWEEGARRVMSGKLAIGQELMPGGHWGYYLHPRAWAGNSSPAQNDRMWWLWTKATGLYPTIYLGNPDQHVEQKTSRVVREVAEAVRIQDKFSPPNTVIYPYSNINQGPHVFFMEDHLQVTLGVPADMGASGIVLWGSSSYYRVSDQCTKLHDYVHNVLGPFVRNLTHFTSDCSQALCGGHGRCVHNSKDVLIPETEAVSLSDKCTPRDSPFRDYHCRCYSHWEGACCERYAPFPCQQATPTGSQPQVKDNAGLIGR
ncbi:hyaluronidase conohyal-P1-like [Littorina saxatilis]|uniref:Hyaluronidase n=1 Tax=Littorina saxatilis TaxID=31220 RepID=A0AAN9BLV3_9CAEN